MTHSQTAALPPHSLDLRTTAWFEATDEDTGPCPELADGCSLFPQPGLVSCHRQTSPARDA